MGKFKLKPETYTPILVIIVGTIIPLLLFNGSNFLSLFLIATYSIMIFVLALFIKYLIIKTNQEARIKRFEKKLIYNLNDSDVYLIDYENTGCLPKEISKTEQKTVYYIFVGRNQNEKIKKELRSLSITSNVEIIYIDKTGKNLLDIGLGMYVGAIYSSYSPKNVYIFSKDKGYQSLIQIAEDLGYHNLYSLSPVEDVLISDESLTRLYKNVYKNSLDTTLSLGNFKKKIRKTRMNMTPDEVNYAVNKFTEWEYITITTNNNYQTVHMKKIN